MLSNFCAESATSDRGEWQVFVTNITSLVKPGGSLVLSALKGATRYTVGSVSFPAVYLTEDDVADVLEESGFVPKSIELRSVPADRASRDYQGLIFAVATKRDCAPAGAR